jgi:N-acetylneuraminic acid mutarotase
MNLSAVLLVSLLTQSPPALGDDAKTSPPSIEWSRLPSLPDKEGFATMFAGTSGGALVVAGGANFPGKFPWEGGTKGWYDTIYVLDRPQGQWRVAAEKLPRPLGYGVSATWDGALICAGGSDLKRHYADVFALRLVDGKIQTETLPALPQPCANLCGCLVGSRLFVAGGTASPEATEAMKTFWGLDLAEPKGTMRWKVLEPWPGLERSHAVAAELDGSFVLMSGFRWKAGPKGEVVRIAPFETDCYRYTPRGPTEGTWKRLADVPRAIGAAPTPALTHDSSRIYVIGGIDDSAALPEPSTHPGFPLDVFCYDAKADRWNICGQMPAGSSRVTASAVVWQGRYAIINGERAPGRRSPDIHTAVIREGSDRKQGQKGK